MRRNINQVISTRTIREYYERNTALFLRATPTATIHRAVWAEGVNTLDRALNYTNAQVTRIVAQHARAHPRTHARILDLGCGVGGTLFYVLTHLPIPAHGIGVTLSQVQAQIARAHALELNLAHICDFIQADFQFVPVTSQFDVIVSVEAFAHATAPERYFDQITRLLKPGGQWIVCDDFLAARALTGLNAIDQAWLAAYQRGWQVPNVRAITWVESIAAEHGLRLADQCDLTPHLRLRALPNPVARALQQIGERLPKVHPIVPSMLGSLALQNCLKRGLVTYRFLVFEQTTG